LPVSTGTSLFRRTRSSQRVLRGLRAARIFLITTPAGHILINSDYEETIPVIRAAVETLGFKFSDIKILLGSHAHPDHMSGDALFKE